LAASFSSRGDDRPGSTPGRWISYTPGKISFNFDSSENKSAEILAPIQLNKWQHVIAIFDRGAMKLYLDGVLAASAQTELRPNPILDSKYNPALGIGNTGGTVYNIPSTAWSMRCGSTTGRSASPRSPGG
jgi:hypothetical protein